MKKKYTKILIVIAILLGSSTLAYFYSNVYSEGETDFIALEVDIEEVEELDEFRAPYDEYSSAIEAHADSKSEIIYTPSPKVVEKVDNIYPGETIYKEYIIRPKDPRAFAYLTRFSIIFNKFDGDYLSRVNQVTGSIRYGRRTEPFSAMHIFIDDSKYERQEILGRIINGKKEFTHTKNGGFIYNISKAKEIRLVVVTHFPYQYDKQNEELEMDIDFKFDAYKSDVIKSRGGTNNE